MKALKKHLLSIIVVLSVILTFFSVGSFVLIRPPLLVPVLMFAILLFIMLYMVIETYNQRKRRRK